MERLAGGQGNKYGGVGVAGCSDSDGELRRKEAAAGQALPPQQRDPALAVGHRQPEAWAPHSEAWKDRPSGGQRREVGRVSTLGQSQSQGEGVQRLKDRGPWPWSLESSRLEGESRQIPFG